MEYRGIQFMIRTGIERGQWHVAIHPSGNELREIRVFGARKDAEFKAHAMIDEWLKKRRIEHNQQSHS